MRSAGKIGIVTSTTHHAVASRGATVMRRDHSELDEVTSKFKA